jgi:hypothetical protein
MPQLVILHEGAVDDWHPQVDVEHDRHRLKLADDDVGEHSQEWEDSLGVRRLAGELVAKALVFLA